ncbi:SDR family NAD(P)-dependent oxidoreductase [Marispirochaeta sp.]|uniref:SDR family NAD(P)-dependent oxidoreductase n=1 Tax=Marispirochaeta sp. TaxID=2038653 RepID=UPI0029C83C18|nr:SDR family NAD(P)-dependent oxidoreductase [Marispirochaeta sp.]
MEQIKGKTVFISGASSGIGRACAESFAAHGARIIISSRKISSLQTFADELGKTYHVEVHPLELDVTSRKAVQTKLESLPPEWKSIDILINNAGLALGMDKLQEGDISDWEAMIDTNVKGLLYLTRTIVPGIIERGGGQVINIGSTAGIAAYPRGAVYCATKAAVKFLSDGLRMDVVDQPVRVTNIQPGMVETNFSNIRFKGDEKKAASVYQGIEALKPEDIADIALYTASVPGHVQICEVTVTPTNQATMGIIHKTS